MKGIRDESGFTLIEALVALIIIIAVATILYGGLTAALRISGTTDQTETALRVAKTRLEAAGVEAPLQTGQQEGQDGGMSWRIAVRPYIAGDEADRAAQLQAYWVSITVSWGNRQRSVTLTTLKLGQAE